MALVGKAALVLVFLFMGFMAFRLVQFAHHMKTHPDPKAPGEAEFREANRQIIRYTGQTGLGNSAKAIKLAQSYSENLKVMRKGFFTEGNKDAYSLSKGEFLTYCHRGADSCVFLVHVPELRRYTADAQETMANLAWANAQAVLKTSGLPLPATLAVGVKGTMLYEAVLVGKPVADLEKEGDGITERGAGISGTVLLYPFFAAAAESGLASQTTLERVRSEVAGILGKRASDVNVAKPLVDQGADELDIVEIVMALEEAFQFEISDSAIDDTKILTVESLVRIVDQRDQAQKPASPEAH